MFHLAWRSFSVKIFDQGFSLSPLDHKDSHTVWEVLVRRGCFLWTKEKGFSHVNLILSPDIWRIHKTVLTRSVQWKFLQLLQCCGQAASFTNFFCVALVLEKPSAFVTIVPFFSLITKDFLSCAKIYYCGFLHSCPHQNFCTMRSFVTFLQCIPLARGCKSANAREFLL